MNEQPSNIDTNLNPKDLSVTGFLDSDPFETWLNITPYDGDISRVEEFVFVQKLIEAIKTRLENSEMLFSELEEVCQKAYEITKKYKQSGNTKCYTNTEHEIFQYIGEKKIDDLYDHLNDCFDQYKRIALHDKSLNMLIDEIIKKESP